MRPEALTRYSGRLAVESAALGEFEVEVPAAPGLDREVDAVWVTTRRCSSSRPWRSRNTEQLTRLVAARTA